MFKIDNRDKVLVFWNVAYDFLANVENMPNVPDSLIPVIERRCIFGSSETCKIDESSRYDEFAVIAQGAASLKAPPIADEMQLWQARNAGISL
jgi:hypothetical protein